MLMDEVTSAKVAAFSHALYSAPIMAGPEPDYGSLDGRSHYASGIYNSNALRGHAMWFVTHKDDVPHDFVVATGKSGMSVAFAALALSDFPLVTVRKGESSHGFTIEGTAPKMGRYIVLDDFVSTGNTLARIHRELAEWAVMNGVATPQCAGALLYNRHEIWDAKLCADYIKRRS